jgi:predicted esterase
VLDEVLNVDFGTRRLVKRLVEDGWGVRYGAFDGGHTLPEPVVRVALRYLNGIEEDSE